MASGTGRLTFLDTGALRSIYPGTFPTEFMFRSPSNLFSTVQFIPERVLEFSISPVSIHLYATFTCWGSNVNGVYHDIAKIDGKITKMSRFLLSCGFFLKFFEIF